MKFNKNMIFGIASLILTVIGIGIILLGGFKYPEYSFGFSLTGTGFVAIGWAFNALKGRV
jgi:hypothetical protein